MDIFNLLMDNNADIHATDNDGFTPLHDVLANPLAEKYDVLKYKVTRLLERGTDPNARSKNGTYALHLPA